jgi:hypothetical protein
MDGVADVGRAADDFKGLGEATEDWGERERVERGPNVVVSAQVGDEVAHGAGGPDERDEADGDLCDCAWQTEISGKVAEE